MDRSRRRRNRVPLALMWLGVAMVVLGFWTLFEGQHAYRVAFSGVGDECEGNALTLSRRNGEPLQCNFSETGDEQFSAEERALVVDVAGRLGADGLSAADQAQVRELVSRIGAAHGGPGISDDRMLGAGHFCAIAGFPLAFLSFTWWTQRRAR